MGREKTGRPKGIDTWREIQYLDLERRRLNVPRQTISWDMLSEELKRLLGNKPTGVYGGDGSTYELGFNEQGSIVFIPIYFSGGYYGSCTYGISTRYSVYASVYGDATYGTDLYGVSPGAQYGGAIYGQYTAATGEYGGSSGYGDLRYG